MGMYGRRFFIRNIIILYFSGIAFFREVWYSRRLLRTSVADPPAFGGLVILGNYLLGLVDQKRKVFALIDVLHNVSYSPGPSYPHMPVLGELTRGSIMSFPHSCLGAHFLQKH